MGNAFFYVTTERASLYRAIMRAFVESKERFLFRLSLQDVRVAAPAFSLSEIESALPDLCEWGNLQAADDDGFQITSEGEAVERAFALFDTASAGGAEIQSTALADLSLALQELRQPADARKIHRNLLVLWTCFEDLNATAQTLVAGLERRSGIEAHDARRVIEFGERFVAELVLAGESIGEAVREIDAAPTPLFPQTPQWERLRNWFISQPNRPSNADMLRERVRTAIPVLLSAITSANDRQFNRIDRSNDFRVLARWFEELESDAEAHRLWRSVFGLSPSRHLLINDATLDDYEAQDIPIETSWLDAPPLRISARFRGWGRNSQTGSLSRIIDRTHEKEKLAAATHEEALRILNAQARFGSGHRMRLSELEHLEKGEFELFLDLLGEAVSARLFAAEPVEIVSGDGCLRVKLEPTDDGRQALIVTEEGIFSGPDHWISIEQVSADEVIEVTL